MAVVAPSLLALDFSRAQQDLLRVNKAVCFHYDVMDGHFVNNISFGPGILKQLKNNIKVPVTAHLMVSNPEVAYRYFLDCADKITIHVEVIKDNLLQQIGKEKPVGISLNPATPVEALIPYLAEVDHVLVMSVVPGFGGQAFIDSAYDKVAFLDQYRRLHNLSFKIEVDGGVNNINGVKLIKLGADVLIIGSFLFKQADPNKIITEISKIKK